MERFNITLKLKAAALLCVSFIAYSIFTVSCKIDVTNNSKKKGTNYLTFKGNEAFSLGLMEDDDGYYGKHWDGTVEYSTDKSNWEVWDGTSAIPAVFSDENYYVYLRGKDNTTFADGVDLENALYEGQTAFRLIETDGGTSLNVECSGDIMTLLDYKSPSTAEMGNNCFHRLFLGCRALTSAPELSATKLSEGCYYYMFYNCSGLKSAPALPAKELTDNCYCSMFYGCTSLETAPALPATTLADYCYADMFSGCTSLKSVSKLPATILEEYCYSRMFYGCTSLTVAPELPATTLADGCYTNMFCKSGITSSPALPATAVAYQCYNQMFASCTSLTSAGKISAATINQTSAMFKMFYGCTNLCITQLDAADDFSFLTLETVLDTATVIHVCDSMFSDCYETGYKGSGKAGKSYRAVTPIQGNVTIAGGDELGIVTLGTELTATYTPAASGETVTYQWYRSDDLGMTWKAIDDATGASYKITDADTGMDIKVIVTGSGSYGGTAESNYVSYAFA